MQNLKTTEIRLPFCGFYESEAASMIDQEIEQSFDPSGQGEDNVPPDFYDHWSIVHKPVEIAFSKKYVEWFLTYFKDKTGISIGVDFKELVSPKFYNYETDKIFGLISPNDVLKLYNAVDHAVLNTMVHDRHSSRSGFVSFYANKLGTGEWLRPISDWDEIQLETLILALLRQNDVDNIDYYEMFKDCNCNGELSNIVWDNCAKECLDMLDEYDEKHRA